MPCPIQLTSTTPLASEWSCGYIVTRMTTEIDEAVSRLRAIAALAPGYAPALLNLAGEIEAAAESGDGAPEASTAGLPADSWAAGIAAVIIGTPR